MLAGYAVLAVLLAVIESWRSETPLVLWSGTFRFEAGDQAAIDLVESRHGSNVNRVATRYRDPRANLELVSELRVVEPLGHRRETKQ